LGDRKANISEAQNYNQNEAEVGKLMKTSSNVIQLHRWEVYGFPWGTAVREQRTGKWTNIFLRPDGQEIDVSNIEVILHDNGIEFLIGGDLRG
jgi:hypothetical protein